MRDIKKIVEQMTLEEKAGMCSGLDFWHLKGVERLGIPSVMVTDGPHGLRKQNEAADHLGLNDSVKAVCFPAACATAASFDEELVEKMGEALGEECRAEQVSVLLGPAVNIKRSPLCGRNFEYYSEDPYLTGKLAAAQIKGVQKWDVGTSIKHFAANNQETRRMTISSEMDERTLREIYLKGFEIAIKEAKPWTVMCSYNRINGEYCSENRKLLHDILREEWGFEGFVMSDWGAVDNHVKGVGAGMELQMPGAGPDPDKQIVQAVLAGEMEESVLDTAVERILHKIFEYADVIHPEAVFDREKHHAAAAKTAAECAVLLKNEDILPLDRNDRVVYIGAFAQKPRYQGGGSSHINASKVSTALDTAREKGMDIVWVDGFTDEAVDEERLEYTVQAAKEAEQAVIFAGLPDSFESEGYDRTHMQLPECQNRLIEEVLKVQKNTVIVLHNGSPVEMPWIHEAGAVLEMYLGGQGVGEAADALLYGDANPCGRLPESFPVRLEDNPSYLNFPGEEDKVSYAEGIYVGYRYYEKKNIPVLFPFGHGLSYTEFAYKNAKVQENDLNTGGEIKVCVDVKNIGRAAGKEVVQLYIADETKEMPRPLKELKGFRKILLQPGETKTVEFTLKRKDFAVYSENSGGWFTAAGTYGILFAHSSADIRQILSVGIEGGEKRSFQIDRNTRLGLLLKEPKTAQVLERFQTSLFDEEDAGEVMTAEMIEQMMRDMPLRTLCNFGGMNEESMNELIAMLRIALEGEEADV